MSIRAGQILTHAGVYVIDRIQSATPGLNIPEERMYELGNFETLEILRDIPDLSFDLESLDTSCELEAIACGVNPSFIQAGQEFNLATMSKPLDITSPWKSAQGVFTAVKGLAIPYLTFEQANYRFGVGQSSTQSMSFRGDAIYMCQGGAPRYQVFAGAGASTYTFEVSPAIKTVEQGVNLYAYCVHVVFADGTYKRLFLGDDYSNTATGFTILDADNAPATSFLHVVYAAGTLTSSQGAHADISAKPSAVRGKDIDVYLSDGAATPTLVRLRDLQAAELTQRLNLDVTEELGNTHVVSRDYDSADCTGTLTMKPSDITYFMEIAAQVAGVSGTDTINALSSTPLELHVGINHPTTGTRLKTFIVEDARFRMPVGAMQANSRLEVPLPFTSDSGALIVVNGTPL